MHGFELEARSGDTPVDYNKLRKPSYLGLVNCGKKSVSNGVPVRVHNIVNTRGSQHREQNSSAKAHNIVNKGSMLPEKEALWTRKKNAVFVAERSVGFWMV
jgi:hypothetical protein